MGSILWLTRNSLASCSARRNTASSTMSSSSRNRLAWDKWGLRCCKWDRRSSNRRTSRMDARCRHTGKKHRAEWCYRLQSTCRNIDLHRVRRDNWYRCKRSSGSALMPRTLNCSVCSVAEKLVACYSLARRCYYITAMSWLGLKKLLIHCCCSLTDVLKGIWHLQLSLSTPLLQRRKFLFWKSLFANLLLESYKTN